MACKTYFATTLVLILLATLELVEGKRASSRRRKNRVTKQQAKGQLYLVGFVMLLSILPVALWGVWTLARDPALPYVLRRSYNWCVRRAFGSLGSSKRAAKKVAQQVAERRERRKQQKKKASSSGGARSSSSSSSRGTAAGGGGGGAATKRRPAQQRSVGWSDVPGQLHP
jgi:uncharacterized membrane protein YgcG